VRIWNVVLGEPVPVEGNKNRLHRSGLINEILASKGHEVHWWTSSFDHFSKLHHSSKYRRFCVSDGYTIHLLHGSSYRKNISLQRIVNHIQVAREFKRLAQNAEKPDLVVCGYPSIELAYNAVSYAKRNKIPVIVDARDMWPDIFSDVMPKFMKPIARLVLAPYFRMATYVFKNATAIIGVTEGFVDWAVGYSGRGRGRFDQAFYLAYPKPVTEPSEVEGAKAFWLEKRINEQKSIISYVGAVSTNKIDIKPIFRAAELLKKNPDVVFVIAGEGDDRDYLINEAKNLGLSNVCFPGWVNKHQIRYLLQNSRFGLVPLHSREDYVASIPNKPIEYLANNLPILSSLSGELSGLLAKERVGYSYHNGESLVEILADLDESAYSDLKVNAERLFSERFCADDVYSRFEALLMEITANFKKETDFV
jgi:glycosyltransferase involved in cell wall biosynthesis